MSNAKKVDYFPFMNEFFLFQHKEEKQMQKVKAKGNTIKFLFRLMTLNRLKGQEPIEKAERLARCNSLQAPFFRNFGRQTVYQDERNETEKFIYKERIKDNERN